MVQSWASSPELLNIDLSHNNISGSIPDVELGRDLLIEQPRTHAPQSSGCTSFSMLVHLRLCM